MNAACDIATFLEPRGIGVVGTDIFIGPVRPVSTVIPQNAVFVLGTGGPAGARTHGNGETRYPTIQVRIRDTDLIAGGVKAENVYTALEGAKVPGYSDCVGLQSAPIFMQQDQNKLYHWSLNFELMR